MHICVVSVYMKVCMYVCLHICMYVYLCLHMYICKDVRIHVFMYVMYVCYVRYVCYVLCMLCMYLCLHVMYVCINTIHIAPFEYLTKANMVSNRSKHLNFKTYTAKSNVTARIQYNTIQHTIYVKCNAIRYCAM